MGERQQRMLMKKLTKAERREARAELGTMLTYCRPHLSSTEDEFIGRFIDTLPKVFIDGFGNRLVSLPNPDGSTPRTMFSAHTDTVHRKAGIQLIQEHGPGWLYCLPEGSESSCLGGDNTVGVWILVNMVRRGVPGLYVFHRGEEVGRLGSEWLAQNNHNMLEHIDHSIAFDRRGDKSIITHQMCQRTCSKQFAVELSGILGLGHIQDDTGSYTDTFSYVDLIPECTNVSAGFDGEHTSKETVDIPYAMRLLQACLRADWGSLGSYRDPSVPDYGGGWWMHPSKTGAYINRSDHGYGNYGYKESSDYDEWYYEKYGYHPDPNQLVAAGDPGRALTMLEAVKTYPDAAADMLREFGISPSDLYYYGLWEEDNRGNKVVPRYVEFDELVDTEDEPENDPRAF